MEAAARPSTSSVGSRRHQASSRPQTLAGSGKAMPLAASPSRSLRTLRTASPGRPLSRGASRCRSEGVGHWKGDRPLRTPFAVALRRTAEHAALLNEQSRGRSPEALGAREAFDVTATHFSKFNAHYPSRLRDYFSRPRAAPCDRELPDRLAKASQGDHWGRLSTYGLGSEEQHAMKTEADILRADPIHAGAERSRRSHGTMVDRKTRNVVAWNDRHHATVANSDLHASHRHFFGEESRLEGIPLHHWRGLS
ncbi:hypothetical protein M885DRAFT_614581 [Pelagophyceae sp. CCMP2097]|nr:hypothetical protein M885DRAFT_614581 [Pelagophyceae sp. CCMP2097]